MWTIAHFFKMFIHPRRTAREILARGSVGPAFAVVLVFGIVVSLLFLLSAIRHDYPPPPDDLQVWIATWGEFSMLPFVKIPAENYRLAVAIIFVPLVLSVWILMAGAARMLSLAFRGKISFDQYAALLGFSFLTWWSVAQLLDVTFTLTTASFETPGLLGQHGPLVQSILTLFPIVEWVVPLSIGGIYNAIVTYEAERFSPFKAAVIGMVTIAPPIIAATVVLR